MRKKSMIVLLAAMTVLITSFCFALVLSSDTGTWPESWPKELERYREQSKSLGVAHGIQENVYEIHFQKREEFERAWPHILKLKTKGAPLILERTPSTYSVSGSTAKTGVRILCPSGGLTGPSANKMLKAEAPWPDYIKLPSGGLPEYVINQDGKWVAYDGKDRKGGLNRSRVDIVLITDGKIIDLNRIPLPADTPIIDNRFKVERQGVESIKRTEKGQLTARIVPSRRRARPGEIVSFKLELVDSNGQSQRIPASARSGHPPRMTLHDSQGEQIGTYSFRYG